MRKKLTHTKAHTQKHLESHGDELLDHLAAGGRALLCGVQVASDLQGDLVCVIISFIFILFMYYIFCRIKLKYYNSKIGTIYNTDILKSNVFLKYNPFGMYIN